MESKKGIQQIRDVYKDDHIDDYVDDEIKLCLSETSPKSFFMFAGAGSGKTRSLINALTFLDKERGKRFSYSSQQIAVITYTNAACDEISRRLQYKSIFAISTIHSFLWNLIKDYQRDIKKWVIDSIKNEIAELNELQRKGRGGNAAKKREKDIERKTNRLDKIKEVKRISYNPNGDNMDYDSLNHSQVIKMGSDFIAKEETMQEILVGKYPILLIDESQDTKKELVEALKTVYEKYSDRFIIGMFGDTMQRIYMDGKDNLAEYIPKEWKKPKKIMNHRSAVRIVELANAIRKSVDDQQQKPHSDAEQGTVCLFIADSSATNKDEIENQVSQYMVEKTSDEGWSDSTKYKSLILEHHMAANRFGFINLYAPLNESKLFDTSLRDGTISELAFLANVVSPLVKAYSDGNAFEVSKIIRQNSPFLDKKTLQEDCANQINLLERAEHAVDELLNLWKDGSIPTCIEVIRTIKVNGLFSLNDRVDNILAEPVEDEDKKITALRTALSVPFDELESYASYVTDKTRFATHQGVKGLEYPRVMVIIDDSEAKGFLFSYNKLFGVKNKTDTDIKNELEGKDTSILRTTRLFYVACTRAKSSLAVVVYTDNKSAVKNAAIEKGWFSEEEIEMI